MNPERHHPITILVVDDNVTDLGLICDHLEGTGFEILTARYGKDGIEKAHRARPDLILLDVLMPGIDGFETCRRLKADPATKDIPVIFMTALNNVKDKVKGFAVGGVDYITKPLQEKEVVARIETHLTLRNMQKSLEVEIAERKRAQAELQEKNLQLAELNASKDKFFSIISHDLRSPLTIVLGFSEVLKKRLHEDYPQSKLQDYAEKVYSSAKHLYTLLENLLIWARIQRGVMVYEPERLNLYDLAEKDVALFAPYAEQKHISLKHSIQPETYAYADKNMVNTILRNLISNALKFTPSGGKIEVSARRTHSETYIEIAVSDTGIGIRKENLPKLFRIDIHYTSDGTAGETGTGLGLILCRDLVKKNGGNIWVESEVGEGTTFRFTLPEEEIQ